MALNEMKPLQEQESASSAAYVPTTSSIVRKRPRSLDETISTPYSTPSSSSSSASIPLQQDPNPHGINLFLNQSDCIHYRDNHGRRCIRPYIHVFPTRVKARWKGRGIYEVFSTEFGGHDAAYYEKAIITGCIRVCKITNTKKALQLAKQQQRQQQQQLLHVRDKNHAELSVNDGDGGGNITASSSTPAPPLPSSTTTKVLEMVPLDYKLVDGDYIAHYAHRHEPPVTSTNLAIVGAVDDPVAIAVLKPGGIPVHPCGPHHFLSLLALVNKELGLPIHDLHPVHRLDRLTSGVVILAKTKQMAAALSEQMRSSLVKKRYVALVEGEFPESCGENTSKTVWNSSSSSSSSSSTTSHSTTAQTQVFECSTSHGNKKSTLTLPALLSILPEDDDVAACQRCPWIAGFRPHEVVTYCKEEDDDDSFGGSNSAAAAAAAAAVAATASKMHHHEDDDDDNNKPLTAAEAKRKEDPSPYSLTWTRQGYLRVSVAVREVNPKRGTHGIGNGSTSIGSRNSSAGGGAGSVGEVENVGKKNTFLNVSGDKPSVTLFRKIACGTIIGKRQKGNGPSSSSDERRVVTLVEALPLSGRTHQIRLHAAWLGHPIADDPVYCANAASELMDELEAANHDEENVVSGEEEEEDNNGNENVTVTLPQQQHTSSSSTPGALATIMSRVKEAIVMSASLDPIIDSALVSATKSICVSCALQRSYHGESGKVGPSTSTMVSEFFPLQRLSRGIALHSCEYKGPAKVAVDGNAADSDDKSKGWHFVGPLPAWAGDVVVEEH